MKRRRFLEALTACLFAVLLTAVLATPAMAQGKSGNNKNKEEDGDGGTEEPVLPDIEYTAHNFAPPNFVEHTRDMNVYDFNNTGMAVGVYLAPDGLRHGWLYDPVVNPDFAIDLNDLEIAGVPDGWYISSVLGINDLGLVVGYVTSTPDREERRGFVLDTLSSPLTLSFLPDDAYSYTYPRKINNNGDIVGVFRRPDDTWGVYAFNPDIDEELEIVDVNSFGFEVGINEATVSDDGSISAAQVVGTTSDYVPFVYTRYIGLQYLNLGDPAWAEHIDDHSTVYGTVYREEEEPYRGNKTKTVTNTYLFRDPGTAGEFEETKNDRNKFRPLSVNSHGAILTGNVNANYVHTDVYGFVDVTSLSDLPDKSLWHLNKMNNVAVEGFGELVGKEQLAVDGVAAGALFLVLTPRRP